MSKRGPVLAALSLILLAVLSTTSTAAAQDTRDLNRSGRGRLSDSGARLEAQGLADRAGLTCRVINALALGRDTDNNRQFEVACEEGRGYRLIAGSGVEALDCLLLMSGAGRACRLPENRDTRAIFSGLARAAGLTCEVDDGTVVGRSQDGGTIYDIGCADDAGAWIETSGTAWKVTDCFVVEAQGGSCRFTTPAERLVALVGRLPTDALPGCSPMDARFMGRDPATSYYEVLCRTGGGAVVAFDPSGDYRETIACPDARLIGDGCRLATNTAPRDD